MKVITSVAVRTLFLLMGCIVFPAAGWAQAGQSSTAQLTLTLTVQSSIGLVFNNNPAVGSNGFCPLTNAGTNNVGLSIVSGRQRQPGLRCLCPHRRRNLSGKQRF